MESVGEASFDVVATVPCGGSVEGEDADSGAEDCAGTSLGKDDGPWVGDASD